MPLLARLLPYLLVVALGGGALFGAYRHGRTTSDVEWQAKWAAQAAELADTHAKAERIQRDEEQRRLSAITEVQTNARKAIDQAVADAAAADAAAAGLREQAKRLAARARTACSHPGTTAGSPPATGPADVLADVLSRADARAGELAAVADRARVAGLACERAYDALSAAR